MSLPINRSAKSTLDANLVNGITSDAPALKASDDVVYNTIDELYNYALSLVTSGTLSPLPPKFMYSQIAINPNFDIWQMGTSFVNPASLSYMADQWYSIGAITATFSEQTASPPVGSSSYACMTVNALGGYINFGQCLESDICNKLKGQRVSLSILMRRDPTFDGQYQLLLEKNAAADTSGGTWTNIGLSSVSTLDTSWSLLKLENVLIPADSNGLRVQLAASGGTRPVNSYVEFSQLQWNIGSTVQPFQPRSEAEEKVLCEWFLEKSYNYADVPGAATSNGLVGNDFLSGTDSTGFIGGRIPFKSKKRTTPTITIYDTSGNVGKVTKFQAGGAGTANTTATIAEQSEGSFRAYINGTAAVGFVLHYVADARL